MSRPLRISYPGALYHVTSRGNHKADIFIDDDDRHCFMAVLTDVCSTYGWVIHSYCLMSNHWHLVVETPDPNLSAGMRQLNGLYTMRFNRRHETVGHLFQGRYGAFLVEKEGYFLELCRYVVLNPVRAGIVDAPSDWEWSSYRATSGLSPAQPFLDLTTTRDFFSPSRTEAIRSFRDFVLSGIGLPSPLVNATGVVLGSEKFILSIIEKGVMIDLENISEIPRRERHIERRPLPELFKGPMSTSERDLRIGSARKIDGYPVSEIARHLGLHPATVSNIIHSVRRNARGARGDKYTHQ